MIIYGDLISGNCLKVKYTADFLGLAYAWHDVDVVKGEARKPEFLTLNPMGQVPAVVLDDGRVLAQSNAIIRYLARDSKLLPADAYLQAKVDELLFWEQYSHEPYIAVNRFHLKYLGKSKDQLEQWRVDRGNAALALMEKLLSGREWFVGQRMTIADIALFGYTQFANEGGFDLSPHRNISAWVKRCQAALNLKAIAA